MRPWPGPARAPTQRSRFRDPEDSAVTSPEAPSSEPTSPAAPHRRILTVIAASGSGCEQRRGRRALAAQQLRAEGDGPAITIDRHRPCGRTDAAQPQRTGLFNTTLAAFRDPVGIRHPNAGRGRPRRHITRSACNEPLGRRTARAHRRPLRARSARCGDGTPRTPSERIGVSHTGNTSGAPVFVSRPCALALLRRPLREPLNVRRATGVLAPRCDDGLVEDVRTR